MAWLMTAPSRVMRLASQRGTCPPWSGRSAVPALRAIGRSGIGDRAADRVGPLQDFPTCSDCGTIRRRFRPKYVFVGGARKVLRGCRERAGPFVLGTIQPGDSE